MEIKEIQVLKEPHNSQGRFVRMIHPKYYLDKLDIGRINHPQTRDEAMVNKKIHEQKQLILEDYHLAEQ